MPYKPKHPCKHPGCPGLTHGSYCDKHAPFYPNRQKNRLKDNRPTLHARPGYGSAWLRIRRRYLKDHSICEYCGVRPATQVDHRIPVREGGGHEQDNLAASCQACHNRKTGGERSGRGVWH